MGNRLALHQELVRFAANVYYQPPATVRMKYPCIVYDLASIDSTYADNRTYQNTQKYSVTYISEGPADDLVLQFLEAFRYIRFDRHYTADNLHHYVFNLYY